MIPAGNAPKIFFWQFLLSKFLLQIPEGIRCFYNFLQKFKKKFLQSSFKNLSRNSTEIVFFRIFPGISSNNSFPTPQMNPLGLPPRILSIILLNCFWIISTSSEGICSGNSLRDLFKDA